VTHYLSRFPLFADLPEADRDILERLMVVERHPRGHAFMEEGKAAAGGLGAMFLVLEGEVDVMCRAPEGGFGVHRTMGPGEVFGIVALLDDAPRSATVRARGPVVASSMSRAVFREIHRRHVGVYARFQLAIARQLAADVRRLDLTLGTAFGSGAVAETADALSATLQGDVG
jgi:CRP/FNR family cyclic AMP-dependent transcriptional regulator